MPEDQHSDRTIHALSDEFVGHYAALDPLTATAVGLPGHDAEMTDFSPEALEQRAELGRAALARITAATPADDGERVAQAVFAERIGLELEIYDSGWAHADMNVIGSPVHHVRQIFDLMPTETADDWAVIAGRMSAVSDAVDGVIESMRYAAARGKVVALRQVTKVAEQCDVWSGASDEKAFFAALADQANTEDEALRKKLTAAAGDASAAFARFASFLRDELAAKAPEKDAVGEERYRMWSRQFLGSRLDLQEAYEWGWAEFSRIETEMKQVADRIKSGATLKEAAAALDADPRYRVTGKAGLEQWMQQLSDAALADLRGTHFDLPDELMKLECLVAPPGGGVGAYYTGPNDDFSRPGRMWWSVEPGREDFSTWREVSTVYHEGVPGHHLQIATAVYERERLNDFQRMLCWVSGHGEGWALYAERLMRELGYLEDDANLFGMLDAHLFRAGRVIVDLGMHLELEIPRGTGFHEGERWTPELGLEFMLNRTITDPAQVTDEIDRYLGWPGQAPAYKLGERLWLQAREEARARHGAAFDLKTFHQQALALGSMGLDTLREQLARL
ncbi:DUF885 domain-containing protein [Labedaea rhizosphaerae]|uniref:Uncharacterized protein (DUF885 family) n=1 Tax=Labedaea rhizosphaerae TaxID=598644 RepID=A0A4R6S9K8_LABRH|nr:DUF885 domain-containing protein [Labedaea rhizosphaerae]TDP96037.1 uncharacterized protein (DUF885 family) [Labedaea rhizosphaerae]